MSVIRVEHTFDTVHNRPSFRPEPTPSYDADLLVE